MINGRLPKEVRTNKITEYKGAKVFNYKGMPFVAKYGVQTCLEPVCLDIETSHKDDVTWITSIQVLWGKEYHLFNCAEQLCEWYKAQYKKYGLGINTYKGHEYIRRLVTYVHNLSYEASYLLPYFKAYLPEYVDEDGEPMCDSKGRPYEAGTIITNEHDIIQYVQGALMFRCSYHLSNRSLASWGNALNIKNKKKVGFYDYTKVRFPDEIDKLSQEELDYDKYDVLSLQECLRKQMYLNHEALVEYGSYKQIPLTSTGYVRRDLAESCLNSEAYMERYFRVSRLTGELYNAMVNAFAGGYTHNNRFLKDRLVKSGTEIRYRNRTIKVGTIGHRDFKSHYPTNIRTRLYPLGAWKVCFEVSDNGKALKIEDVLKMYPKYSSIIEIRFHEATIIDEEITMPFLQESKLYVRKSDLKYKVCDNGKVMYLKCKEDRYVSMYVDNVTLGIINSQYKLNYQIVKVWRSLNAPMPKEISDVVDKYFKGKSDKKNVWKECVKKYGINDDRTKDADTETMLVKALLNACYGCFAQRLSLDDYYCDRETCEFKMRHNYDLKNDTTEDIERKNFDKMCEDVEHYYEKSNTWRIYALCVYITAYSRAELFEYMDVIAKATDATTRDYSHILYCDTDSIYYISTPEIEKAIDDLNSLKRASAPSVRLDNGKDEYYDSFESEGSLRAFKGLHSKCYGYVTEAKNEFKLTVAGVPSKTIIGMDGDEPVYLTREEELACYVNGERVCESCEPCEALDKLSDGYVFYINTSNTAKYVNYNGEIKTVTIDGHTFTTAGGCIIEKGKTKAIKPFSMTIFGEVDSEFLLM